MLVLGVMDGAGYGGLELGRRERAPWELNLRGTFSLPMLEH